MEALPEIPLGLGVLVVGPRVPFLGMNEVRKPESVRMKKIGVLLPTRPRFPEPPQHRFLDDA